MQYLSFIYLDPTYLGCANIWFVTCWCPLISQVYSLNIFFSFKAVFFREFFILLNFHEFWLMIKSIKTKTNNSLWRVVSLAIIPYLLFYMNRALKVNYKVMLSHTLSEIVEISFQFEFRLPPEDGFVKSWISSSVYGRSESIKTFLISHSDIV